MSARNIVKAMSQPDFQNNIWTLLASAVSAVYVSLMVFSTVRFVGLTEAGMLSFAVAVAGLSRVLALFGVRGFQSTDVNQEFSLNSYIALRVCSALAASVGIVVFLLFARIETSRAIVIVLFHFVYLADGIADVFMGDLQQKGKMRTAGRMRVCAFGTSLVAFIITSFIVRSLILPLVIATIVIYTVYAIYVWHLRTNFERVRVKFDVSAIKTLTKKVTPILISSSVFSFIYNSPKYFLGFLSTDESVAVLSILLMPVTFLGLLAASFFGGAELTKTAELFAAGDIRSFTKRITRLMLLSAALSAVFILCAYTFGLPLLSWVYSVDLSNYSREFMLVTFGGAFNIIAYALAVGVLVLRLQKANLVVVMIIAIITSPIVWLLVSRYGITGAAFSNMLVYVPLVIASFTLYRISLYRRNKNT